MYKIFIKDKPLILSDNKEEYKEVESSIFLSSDTKEELLFGIDALQNQEKVESLFVYSENLQLLWEKFREDYNFIECAGGIVKNNHGETLLIFRNEIWDLPKGKIESGEDVEAAALREVQEECGLNDLEITGSAGETFHTYSEGETNFLKRTSWFNMEYTGDDEPIPQTSEGISKIQWFSDEEMDKPSEHMYSSLKDLLDNIS